MGEADGAEAGLDERGEGGEGGVDEGGGELFDADFEEEVVGEGCCGHGGGETLRGEGWRGKRVGEGAGLRSGAGAGSLTVSRP